MLLLFLFGFIFSSQKFCFDECPLKPTDDSSFSIVSNYEDNNYSSFKYKQEHANLRRSNITSSM
jgi:hypothetical protein